MTRPAITTFDAEGLRAAAAVLRDLLAATTSLTDIAALRLVMEREAVLAEAILANAEDDDDEAAQAGLAEEVDKHLARGGTSSTAATRVAPSAPAPESGHPSRQWSPERRERQRQLMLERRGGETPWTPERLALLHADYPTRDLEDLLAALNALPGHPLNTVDSLRYRAERDGLRRDPEVALAAKREAMLRGNEKRLTGELPPVERVPPEEQAALRDACRDRMGRQRLSQATAAAAMGVPAGSLAPWLAGKNGSGTAAKVRAWLAEEAAPVVKAEPEPSDGAPPDFDADGAEEARTMLAAGRGARDLAAWFGGSLTWWQAWCERERAQVGRAA